MNKRSEFIKLRHRIDEAITYGQNQEARTLCDEALHRSQMEERLGEIEYFKGQVAILDEDYTAAIYHFDRAVKFNPLDGAAYNDRALCMVELGESEEAFSYLDKGIEVEPDYPNVYHNKGWLLCKVGRTSEAMPYFEKALKLDPERPVTYENLACAYAELHEFSKALELYEKAYVLLKPEYSYIRRQISMAIEAIKDYLRHKNRLT